MSQVKRLVKSYTKHGHLNFFPEKKKTRMLFVFWYASLIQIGLVETARQQITLKKSEVDLKPEEVRRVEMVIIDITFNFYTVL